MSVVLDASAVLAVMLDERGSETVVASAEGALLSTVNLTEVLEKVAWRGGDIGRVDDLLAKLGVRVLPFSAEHARIAAGIKPLVERKQVSLADRACLAVGRATSRTILTADTKWAELDLGLDIRLIR